MEEKEIEAPPITKMGEQNRKSRKQKRKDYTEVEAYSRVLTSCVNQFFKFSNLNKGNKEAVAIELDRCTRQWKTYVSKWNKNKKRSCILRDTDFLNFVNEHTKKLKDEAEAAGTEK